jgi:hypothetical protein
VSEHDLGCQNVVGAAAMREEPIEEELSWSGDAVRSTSRFLASPGA